MFRTPPLPMEPVTMRVGDSVQFAESKRWWKVRAVSDRFVILTSPYNLRNTVFYTIIDWERGVRGPDDHYGVGYETEEEIADAMRRLNLDPYVASEEAPIEVSYRPHTIRLRIEQVRHG